ncbi:MAG: hypothetical protein KAT15_19285, partial [Bacteroidales bacterium]|nr:hypothetical protein [Bacteroidales bacterium]
VYCKLSEANLHNTLVFNSLTEKLLREGRSLYKNGDGGQQAIAPEADFAFFQAQNSLNSNVRKAGAAI